MPNTLVNGRAYAYTDVQTRILGNARPLAGITEISWSVEGANAFNYGAGTEPVSYSFGQNAYSGSMKLHRDEVQLIQNLLPKGKPLTTLAPFDIVVTCDTGTPKLKTDVLKGVLITKHDAPASSGNSVLEDTITFVFAKLESK